MKLPGPDHPIAVAPAGEQMRAAAGDYVIGDSADALTLREADYPPVVYFPREDLEMGFFAKTEKTSHCPYKGDASYYSVFIDGNLLENVAWSYEDPYPAMEAIRGRVAFYTDRVTVYPRADAEAVRDATTWVGGATNDR